MLKSLILASISCLSFLGFAQNADTKILSSALLKTTHSDHLCIDAPTATRTLTTREAYEGAAYVFSGKVVEVIRTRQLEPQRLEQDIHGNKVPLDLEWEYKYWYILETRHMYKGLKKNRIKIHAKTVNGSTPQLQFGRSYLIFAKTEASEEHPYIYCGGNSMHLSQADEVIKELQQVLIH